MKNVEKHLVGWLSVCLLLCSYPVWAQGDAGDYLTIVGMVKDKQNKKALENVNVSVHGSNIGTVTNAEGEFALKIKKTETPRELDISHIGYVNTHISLEKETAAMLTVWLTPHSNLLKGRRYIGRSEAVLDVSKTAYTNRNISYDKVRVEKGRRLLSQKASDTLAVKVVGGPNLGVTLDVVKNKGALLDFEELNNYEFWMAESMLIDNRMQYVINFRPKVILMYALLYGKLYIDRERLSFTRIEMSLDMQNKSKATTAILYKKPLGLRFKPQELSYLVTYKDVDGKTYLNYIRNTIRFKCDWKRKLFSTSYTVASEMVVTDRKEGVLENIPNKEAFSLNQIFYDKVDEYWNPDFGGNYNIIEPTESLEHAVDKLKKQSN